MAESKSAALPLGYAPSMAGSAVWHRTRQGANEKWRNGCKGRFRACGTPFWRLYVAALTGFWPCLRCRSVAQSGSALRSGRRGRRFKSCHSDQNFVGGLAIPRPAWSALNSPPAISNSPARALARPGGVSAWAQASRVGTMTFPRIAFE